MLPITLKTFSLFLNFTFPRVGLQHNVEAIRGSGQTLVWMFWLLKKKKKKRLQTELSCLRAGVLHLAEDTVDNCWNTESHYPKMNHGGKTMSVWDSREKWRIQATYSSPTNQATMGNIIWVIVSWAGLFGQCVCVCVCVCETRLFWLDFGKKAHSFLFVSFLSIIAHSVFVP